MDIPLLPDRIGQSSYIQVLPDKMNKISEIHISGSTWIFLDLPVRSGSYLSRGIFIIAFLIKYPDMYFQVSLAIVLGFLWNIFSFSS